MFRRPVVTGGGDVSGFLLELCRDNHAKGPVSFLVDGGGAGTDFSGAGGAGGGGGNLTGDILPDRPCSALVESRDSRGGSFGSILEVFVPSAGRQLLGSLFVETCLSVRQKCKKEARLEMLVVVCDGIGMGHAFTSRMAPTLVQRHIVHV